MENLTTFLDLISSFFTGAVTWFGDILSMITNNVVLMVFCVAIPVTGFVIGGVKRLLNL